MKTDLHLRSLWFTPHAPPPPQEAPLCCFLLISHQLTNMRRRPLCAAAVQVGHLCLQRYHVTLWSLQPPSCFQCLRHRNCSSVGFSKRPSWNATHTYAYKSGLQNSEVTASRLQRHISFQSQLFFYPSMHACTSTRLLEEDLSKQTGSCWFRQTLFSSTC